MGTETRQIVTLHCVSFIDKRKVPDGDGNTYQWNQVIRQ